MALAAGAALLAGCGAALPKLPSEGGPAWREIQSEHFTLWTNASSARGRELVQDMEERRQVIARAMGGAPAEGRIFAIGLGSLREAQEFMPEQALAMAWDEGQPARQASILFSTDYNEGEDEIVMNHELAHAISYSIVANQPRWFAEGLACYFEMASRDESDGTVEIGVPSRGLLLTVWDDVLMPVEKALKCYGGECNNQRFYATSWAMFSYFLNRYYDRFAQFQQRLNALEDRDEHLALWREVFDGISPSDIDLELKSAARKFKRPRIPVKVKAYAVAERALNDADVLAARALAYMAMSSNHAKSRVAMKAALAIEPMHPLARLLAVAWEEPITIEQARAVVQAHPNEWRAWWLVEHAANGTAEGEAARARRCTLAQKDGTPCRKRAASAAAQLP
jgi:hypothetical protein